jgi:hypothetical protein
MKSAKDLTIETEPAPVIVVHLIRQERVVVDHDVARLFGVKTGALNQQVNRNRDKFGDDYAFRLTDEEFDHLRSQIVISSSQDGTTDWGGVRYAPRVFTEHGVVMAATVLKSERAIQATRLIVRTFVAANHGAGARPKAIASAKATATANIGGALATKLNTALGQVLDAIIDPDDGRTVRDEVKAIAAEGLASLKEYIKRVGITNEKTLAEVRRMMAEAEGIEVETAKKRTENQHRQLALLAKKLRLLIQAQHYAETGSIEGLMTVLSDLEKP